MTGPILLIYRLGGLLVIAGAVALLAAQVAPITWLLPVGGLACTALGIIILMLTSGVRSQRWSSVLTAVIILSGVVLLGLGLLRRPHQLMLEVTGSLLITGAAIFWLWRMRTPAGNRAGPKVRR